MFHLLFVGSLAARIDYETFGKKANSSTQCSVSMSSDMRMSLIITDDDEKLVKETLPDIYVIPSLFPQKTTILNYKAVLKTPN